MSQSHEQERVRGIPPSAQTQDPALREYLQRRLSAFLRHVASAGLAVSEAEAMRNNAAQWTREYQQSEAARPTKREDQ